MTTPLCLVKKYLAYKKRKSLVAEKINKNLKNIFSITKLSQFPLVILLDGYGKVCKKKKVVAVLTITKKKLSQRN